MKNIAVILAAGSGTRLGEGLPKQFRLLPDKRTVIETAIDVFDKHERTDALLVVINCEYRSLFEQIKSRNSWHKSLFVIDGGSERWESSWKAVRFIREEWLKEADCNVLLHDAARPFVSEAILSRVIDALQVSEAVSVAVPVTDTIYTCLSLTQGDRLAAIPPRQSLRRAQTPQAFRLSVLYEAFNKAINEGNVAQATDDCSVVYHNMKDVEITIVEGEEKNKKITYIEDL